MNSLFADETLHRFLRSVVPVPALVRSRSARSGRMRERVRDILDRGAATRPRRDGPAPPCDWSGSSALQPTAAREIGRDLLVESTSGQAMVWAVDTAGPVMSWPPERELGGFVYTVFNATYEGKTAPNSIDARRRAVNGIVAVRVNAQALLDNLPGTDHTLIARHHSPRTDEPPSISPAIGTPVSTNRTSGQRRR
jgi:hypothetical protein